MEAQVVRLMDSGERITMAEGKDGGMSWERDPLSVWTSDRITEVGFDVVLPLQSLNKLELWSQHWGEYKGYAPGVWKQLDDAARLIVLI